MRKLLKGDEKLGIYRETLKVITDAGIQEGRNYYSVVTNSSRKRATEEVTELVQFIQQESHWMVGKGKMNIAKIDEMIASITYTDEEQAQQEREQMTTETRYIWKKVQTDLAEKKRDALRHIDRIQEDLEKAKAILTATIDRPTSAIYDYRITSRAQDFDATIKSIAHDVDKYQELRFLFRAVEKVTGVDIREIGGDDNETE